MRFSRLFSLMLTAAAAATAPAGAQNLGPFRQFLAIEPYYARSVLDAGPNADRVGVNGYGGRLWVNLAPFAGPHRTLISKGALGLFATYTPDQEGRNTTVLHYGAQHDVFFLHTPLGNALDPFLTIGGAGLRVKSGGNAHTDFVTLAGGGIRIPVPNRFQLRFDARDAIVFNSRTGAGGARRTAHNFEFLGAVGITF